MFWGIKKPVNVKIDTFEFKMADKVADRLTKPTHLSAENGNTVFNNVFWIHLVLSWLKHRYIAFSIKKQNILFKMAEKMADKVLKICELEERKW